MFDLFLYTSLIIFALGLIYKVSTWFTRKVGIAAEQYSAFERVAAAAGGILRVFFSAKILTLIKVFILDVLLQVRILKQDPLRWLMHMLIYAAFIGLLLMHAMESIISESFFEEYYSTVNPFMFLRDLFGFLVIIGLGIAVVRRFVLKLPRLKTNAMDHYAIIILALIMLSGVFLEGMKITSHTEFTRMVDDFAGMDDEEEIAALESVWVKDFGLVSPNLHGPFDEETIESGWEAHESNCIDCHVSTKWAFSGYAAGKIMQPIAVALDRVGGVTFFWYIHILSCFIGLAYLPFSKMLHIITTPLSLMANAVMQRGVSHPANIATRQALELDACMHCTTCSSRCSVGVASDKTGNSTILPSEKLSFLKTFVSKQEPDKECFKAIQEGIYLCTNCDRCTVVCPAGINLRELWFDVREAIIQKQPPALLTLSQFSFYRGLNRTALDAQTYNRPIAKAKKAIAERNALVSDPQAVIPLNPIDKDFKARALQSTQGNTFAYCFACENCSTVCPVAGNFENSQEAVDLLPHQIMRSLGLGLKDLAYGSRMLWDCVTCYQCQEHCPQKVKVTDILYELKNQALKELMD